MRRIGKPILSPSGHELPLAAGVIHDGFLFLSGQLGTRNGMLAEGIEEQARAALDNVEALLVSEALELRHVVKTTVWLTRAEDFSAFNAIYARRFAAPYPARSTVVSGLVIPNALVEIEVIAARV